MNAFFALLLLLLAGACQEKKSRAPAPTDASADFEILMGKELATWQNVQTGKDFDNLRFFKALYEKNLPLLYQEKTENTRIPRRLHFIWIGPKEFPRSSIPNVRSWIDHHPEWEVVLWTDRERPLPHPGMRAQSVDAFHFRFLADRYAESENYGEKADLLRYEILFDQGGVYVDHDMKCLRSFDCLNQGFDFYCGLDLPFPTPLPSSIFPTNALIGTRPAHPILAASIQKILGHWEEIGRIYPGSDKNAVVNRVARRSFQPFGDSVCALVAEEGERAIVLPAYYFNAPKEALSLFAHHRYEGTWFENETPFEKSTRERLMYISKKSNRILLACSVMTVFNLGGFALLFLYGRRRWG